MIDQCVVAAQAALNYQFKDAALLAKALIHASVAETRLDSNERMEFLGDAILGMVVSDRIFQLYPEMLEGEMTKLKSTVVSRQTCAIIAIEMGLDDTLVLGKGMRSQAELPPSLAAAVFESIIAAIYIDGGYQDAEAFILEQVDPFIERASECGHQENFKSVLQQFAQQQHAESPLYRILDEKGPDHAKCFKVSVEVGGKRFDSAWGQSKKQAEQLAALNALHELGVIVESEDGHLHVVEPEASDQ